jgi:hypothetical protein
MSIYCTNKHADHKLISMNDRSILGSEWFFILTDIGAVMQGGRLLHIVLLTLAKSVKYLSTTRGNEKYDLDKPYF